MEDKIIKNNKKVLLNISIILIIIIIILLLLKFNHFNVNNNWIGFWGNCVGSLLSGLLSYLIATYEIKKNSKIEKYNKNISSRSFIKISNKFYINDGTEGYISDSLLSRNKLINSIIFDNFFKIKVSNISNNYMYNVKINIDYNENIFINYIKPHSYIFVVPKTNYIYDNFRPLLSELNAAIDSYKIADPSEKHKYKIFNKVQDIKDSTIVTHISIFYTTPVREKICQCANLKTINNSRFAYFVNEGEISNPDDYDPNHVVEESKTIELRHFKDLDNIS